MKLTPKQAEERMSQMDDELQRCRIALQNIRATLNQGGDRNERENQAFHIANRALLPYESKTQEST